MKVRVIQVPYDSGHRNLRMGAGPEHFVKQGAARILQFCGHEVKVDCIEPESAFRAEIKTAFELCRLLAVRVREARQRGEFPLILSGNCNTSLGALGGIDSRHLGMLWFDAHGDFNNPETRESSFFDGMGMSIATGHCWRKLAATIPGFNPLPDSNVIHVGGRDFDPEEWTLLDGSQIQVVTAESIKRVGLQSALEGALGSLSARAEQIYVHVDLDVLDAARTPANEYSLRVPGGLEAVEVEEAIAMARARFQICGGGLASYDPAFDKDGQTFEAGVRIMKAILACDAPKP